MYRIARITDVYALKLLVEGRRLPRARRAVRYALDRGLILLDAPCPRARPYTRPSLHRLLLHHRTYLAIFLRLTWGLAVSSISIREQKIHGLVVITRPQPA
jgi:hypothetical protein